MKTINIRGKEYITVNERLKAFRSEFKDYALIGRIVEQTPDSVIFEAQIIDNKGVVRANGFARETTQKGGVNKFAMLENAETSAWGRALGNFGIGIDQAVCTADELENKLEYENQPQAKPAPALSSNNVNEILKQRAIDFAERLKELGKIPESHQAYKDGNALAKQPTDAGLVNYSARLLEVLDKHLFKIEDLDDKIPDFDEPSTAPKDDFAADFQTGEMKDYRG